MAEQGKRKVTNEEPVVSITLQWYRKKSPSPCEDCGSQALNSVAILKDFRSSGTKHYCDKCKLGFVEKYATRERNPRKVKINKPVIPEVIKGVTVQPYPKYTKPEAIEYHKKHNRMVKEQLYYEHHIAIYGLSWQGRQAMSQTKNFFVEARNNAERMAREYERKARMAEFGV